MDANADIHALVVASTARQAEAVNSTSVLPATAIQKGPCRGHKGVADRGQCKTAGLSLV